jgi:hypothetical protein
MGTLNVSCDPGDVAVSAGVSHFPEENPQDYPDYIDPSKWVVNYTNNTDQVAYIVLVVRCADMTP